VDKLVGDLSYLKKKHNLQVVKFLDELFLGMTDEKLELLSREYSEKVRLPFMIETTIDSLNDKRLKYLKEMRCLNISVGIESGNDEFRNKVLKKHISSKQIVEKINLINKYGIDYSVFIMIGMPYETRKMLFDTIELCKKAKVKCVSCGYFQPFIGAELTEICMREGYIKGDIEYSPSENSPLQLPQISNEEVRGIMKTLMFYVYYPKFFYTTIKILEGDSALSRRLYPLLKKYVEYKLRKNQNKYSDFVKGG
jgi:radical SAM superfamily enzyme YgiQ (UPF0313 family)